MEAILKSPYKPFRFIVLGTLLIMIIVGAGWHYLKNLTPISSTLNPFYDVWVLDGIEIREYAAGPIPSVIHTSIVMIVAGVVILYALEMTFLINTVRTLTHLISDDLAQREINPYHSDRMGGLKPYSTLAILLATYNGLPYLMLIPFIFQYITTSSLISQIISILLLVGIFLGIGLVVWIMMHPLDNTLKRFKEKFDRKVYEAIESPRFGKALNTVLIDGASPSAEDGVFFSAALSLWTITSNMKSSVIDMDEVKRTLIKIAGPVAGFLVKFFIEF